MTNIDYFDLSYNLVVCNWLPELQEKKDTSQFEYTNEFNTHGQ